MPPHICILMGTYNGEKFLAEQLQSIEAQTHTHWRLIISDDGSRDDTVAIARQFQEKWGRGRLELRQGPQQGFCRNFLSMACDPHLRADLYAFSDQDDVWMPDKLSRAAAYFNGSDGSPRPRVYCGRTEIVDEALNTLGCSAEFLLPKTFRNALVESIAGGNTMLFNPPAKELLEKADLLQVVAHDWWLYQIVKGAGGEVFYDTWPSLRYRQHANAAIGADGSIRGRIERILQVCRGRFRHWNDMNYAALCSVRHLLTTDNQEILDIYGKFRGAPLKDRVRLLQVAGIYRQSWRGTVYLWLAAVFNRI